MPERSPWAPIFNPRKTSGVVDVANTPGTLRLKTAILAAGPVGYWELNGSTGNPPNLGSLGGAFDAVPVASHVPSYQNRPAPEGEACAGFVESGQAFAIPDSSSWSAASPSNGLTVFAAIWPSHSETDITRNFIVSKGSAGAYEWGFHVTDTAIRRLEFENWSAAGFQECFTSGDVLIEGEWQVVAAKVNQARTFTRSYHNGVELDTSSCASTNTGTSAPLWIGWRADQVANQGFRGAIGHVAVWNSDAVDLAPIWAAAAAGGWF